MASDLTRSIITFCVSWKSEQVVLSGTHVINHGWVFICLIVIRFAGFTSRQLNSNAAYQHQALAKLRQHKILESGLHKASPCIRFQGSYCNSSPVRYALNSGEFFEGSSHGVSIYRLVKLAIALTVYRGRKTDQARLTASQQSKQYYSCAPNVYWFCVVPSRSVKL